MRELPDGSLILGLYHEEPKKKLAFGATVKSYDGGKTWKDFAILIGERSGVDLKRRNTTSCRLTAASFWWPCASSTADMHFAESIN